MKNKGWHHASVIAQWWNSPVSEKIRLSFSSWRGNFVPVIAPPSSSQLLLISAFQFPPLCKRRVLTYFRLSLRREREAEKTRGSRDGELLGSQFSPASGFPKAWECRFKEKKICPKMMLWLRTLPHELLIPMLANDCLLRELPLMCRLYFKALSATSQPKWDKTVRWIAGQLYSE